MPFQATLKISGRVQGVFYRSEAQEKALELDLSGWIRNEDDGTVTACAQGTREAVNQFIEWCKKGPDAALVENIDVQTSNSPEHIYGGFAVI